MEGFVGVSGTAAGARSARRAMCERRSRARVAMASGRDEPPRDGPMKGLIGAAAALLGGAMAGWAVGAGVRPRLPAPEPVLAGTLYRNKGVGDKLAQVPVFLVTNATGQPYLANMEESHQVGLIFFSSQDATKMLQQMKTNSGAEDAKIYVMKLDKAMEMVRAKPTPSGLKTQSGQDMLMVFRLYPDSNEVNNAGATVGRRRAAESQVPLFVVKGMVVRKGRDRVQPLFFSKQDLERQWERLQKRDSRLPRRPNIEVYDLQDILRKMESGDENLRDWGFFPASESVEFMHSLKEVKSGTAKMHQNPVLGD